MSLTFVRIALGVLVLSTAPAVQAQSSQSSQSSQAAPPAATVPRVVRVDGVFTPANGLPPAAVETVTLALYAGDADATSLWEETQEVRVDGQGRYAVFLGATAAEGLPVSLFAAGASRWLGMRFARPGEGEQARVLLTSVPYALRAADADTLGGLPPSAFLRAAGTKKTGSGATADSDATATDRTPAPNISTGTVNYIGKFTNAVDLTSSVMFENAGRIGINTTTPLDFLHARFSDTSGTVTGLAVQNLSGGAGSYSGMLFYDQNGALGQFQGFNNATHEYRINNIASGGTINFMLNGRTQLFASSPDQINPRIGIGTTTPGDTLHVATGFVRSADGFKMGGAFSSGISQEVNNTLLNIGVNDGRTGAFDNTYPSSSGFFRVDTRSGQSLFTWWEKGAFMGHDTNRMSLTASGLLTVPGIRATGLNANSPVAVLIDANGLMGIATSSRRYKDDIADMGDASDGLMKLRPVTFRYKNAGASVERPTEYGLIAEEVDAVYPGLVAHLANGDVETVQYHKINAMLLNEVQKQHRQLGTQQRELDELRARLTELERLLATALK